jgi:hypothetical protein
LDRSCHFVDWLADVCARDGALDLPSDGASQAARHTYAVENATGAGSNFERQRRTALVGGPLSDQADR